MAGSRSPHGAPPPPDAIRSALGRAYGCEPFSSSPQLTGFLRFIVDAALAGNTRSLKAYTIAVGALGRPDTFDPSRDASVRVGALRLRAALERYYNNEGAEDRVVVRLRRGSYVPEFVWREAGGIAPPLAGRQPPAAETFEPASSTRPALESSVGERRAAFVQCLAHLDRVSGTIAGLKAQFDVAETIMVHSQRLIQLSRREREP